MSNLLRTKDQLGKSYAVLRCNVAVYLLAKLVLLQTAGFERYFILIGTFHNVKNALSIKGKYL